MKLLQDKVEHNCHQRFEPSSPAGGAERGVTPSRQCSRRGHRRRRPNGGIAADAPTGCGGGGRRAEPGRGAGAIAGPRASALAHAIPRRRPHRCWRFLAFPTEFFQPECLVFEWVVVVFQALRGLSDVLMNFFFCQSHHMVASFYFIQAEECWRASRQCGGKLHMYHTHLLSHTLYNFSNTKVPKVFLHPNTKKDFVCLCHPSSTVFVGIGNPPHSTQHLLGGPGGGCRGPAEGVQGIFYTTRGSGFGSGPPPQQSA